jgi:hypothetical protein
MDSQSLNVHTFMDIKILQLLVQLMLLASTAIERLTSSFYPLVFKIVSIL